MAFSTIFTAVLSHGLTVIMPSFGDVDRGQLSYRGRHPVIVDPEAIEHAGVRAARSNLAEIALQRSWALPMEVLRSLSISSSMSGFSLKPQEPRLFASRETRGGACA